MKPFQHIFYVSAIVALGSRMAAVPLDTVSAKQQTELENSKPQESSVTASPANKTSRDKDLETANSSHEPAYVVSVA